MPLASSISAIYLIALFTRLSLLYSNVHKNRHSKCLFKILLWREIDNVTFYFLIFLVKIWRTAFPCQCILELSTFEYGCLIELQIKEGMETLMSNFCLISHCCYIVEKLTVLDSSNLNLTFFRGTAKSFVLKRWKKNVLRFVLLN